MSLGRGRTGVLPTDPSFTTVTAQTVTATSNVVTPLVQGVGGQNYVSYGGGQIKRVRVITAAGAAAALMNDYQLILNKTVGAATVLNLLATPDAGRVFAVKDGKGDAGANNITVTPAAGTIDGAATYVISTNYGKAEFTYNGTEWSVTG